MSSEIKLIDVEALEKKAGQKAARTLQRNWKTILGTATVKETGKLLQRRSGIMLDNSNVRIKMKYGELDSLDINTTSVAMIWNYGFERVKTNGDIMKRKPLSTVETLFNKSENAIRKLAEEIAEIRAEDIATKIVN